MAEVGEARAAVRGRRRCTACQSALLYELTDFREQYLQHDEIPLVLLRLRIAAPYDEPDGERIATHTDGARYVQNITENGVDLFRNEV